MGDDEPAATPVTTAKRKSRPDVAERMKRRSTIVTSVVKMKLNTWCKSDLIAGEISRLAEGLTRVSVETSRFLNLWVASSLDEWESIPEEHRMGEPIPKIDQTFLYRAHTLIATGIRKKVYDFGDTLAEFDRLRPEGMERADFSGNLQILNEASREYLTACKNHVSLNMYSRVRKGFVCFLMARAMGVGVILKAKDRDRIARYYMRRMTRQDADADKLWWSFPQPRTEGMHRLQLFVEERVERNLEQYADLPLPAEKYGTEVSSKWWKYLPWMRHLQREIEAHGGKMFSLLPLSSYDVKHVRITNTTLHGILRRLHESHPMAIPSFSSDPKPFIADSDYWWDKYFHLNKVQRGRHTFEKSFVSDGYGVSVTRSVPKTVIEGGDSCVEEDDVQIDIAGRRIITVDPGARDLVTCMSYDEDGRQITWRYSNAEYCHKIGALRAQKKRRWWRKQAGLEEALLTLPSMKTSSLDQLVGHIVCLYEVLDRVLELNSRRRVREQRFRQYGMKQKAMHDICERIVSGGGFAEDDRPTTIAYGNATFTTRGRFPGPVKAVRRHLQRRGEDLHLVDEDYTSKLCSDCHEALEPMRDGNGRAIHAVRRCTNSDCERMVWHRDVNACLNILYVFLYQITHGERPYQFTRAFQMSRGE